ncbi:ATP-binding cassette sub-family F member 3 [Exaiptasia diaphana]|uniref:Uncharacterized protein n=1 Tax=Exaiptasia diaphana TaxID=2652724 RepID=A0A913Y919_EXADI|nr:ATP-binding cassette sub-family F member 3 [Exaiptasia diaphana]
MADTNGCSSSQLSEIFLRKKFPLIDNDLLVYITDEEADDITSIWIAKQSDNTVVDQKKLQKAEAKLKAKQEKREEKEDRKTPTNIEMDGATASQSANRREAKLEASGTNKSRDIKIENFDLAYGERFVRYASV